MNDSGNKIVAFFQNNYYLPKSRVPGLYAINVPSLVCRLHLCDQTVELVELLGDVDLLDEDVARLTKAGIEAVLDLEPLGHLRVSRQQPLRLVFLK